jgi:hypothetical protein
MKNRMLGWLICAVIAAWGCDKEKPDEGEENIASAGRLVLDGEPKNRFVAQDAPLRFTVTGATLPAESHNAYALINGKFIPNAAIKVTSNSVTLLAFLEDGRNEVELGLNDSQGLALQARYVLWAGSNSLNVQVVNAAGAPVDGASVTVKLGDDPNVSASAVSMGGRVTFSHLPSRTVVVEGRTTQNALAVLPIMGNVGQAQLRLLGFQPASAISNNDFTQGLVGWNVGQAPVSLIPHTENPQQKGLVPEIRFEKAPRVPEKRTEVLDGSSNSQAVSGDLDLQLSTSGQGTQSISRTFVVNPGTRQISVRYRFVTSEVPGGYFGTQYNDFYNISIRSQRGGGAVSDGSSMNALGLVAFDAFGATAWREVSLPVTESGDTVQVDAAVANVSDGALDSMIVIDVVRQPTLRVSASPITACINENVTFQVESNSADPISWTSNGLPATGSGTSLVVRFGAAGVGSATATQNGQSATANATIKESSGAQWVARFPSSTNVNDLTPAFSGAVSRFIGAMQSAGANVGVNATYRPVERAYLMHYAWGIARGGLDPSTVPSREGVEICWVHRNAKGVVDLAASQAAAEAMVGGYGIVFQPALVSRHTERQAIDMDISWTGNLTILNSEGGRVTIDTEPRSGMNSTLHQVGSSYGVIKHLTDRPHWSTDGR